MRHALTIALISAIIVCALDERTARAQEEAPLDPQIAPLANAHFAATLETSGGDGGFAFGIRAAMSYDVLHGNGDTYRPRSALASRWEVPAATSRCRARDSRISVRSSPPACGSTGPGWSSIVASSRPPAS